MTKAKRMEIRDAIETDSDFTLYACEAVELLDYVQELEERLAALEELSKCLALSSERHLSPLKK